MAVYETGNLHRVAGPYTLLSFRDKPDGPETFIFRRADDPSYLFPLPVPNDRVNHFQFDGDHAISQHGRLEIIDLKAKRLLTIPGDEKAPIHQAGFLCRIGPDRLLKIVARDGKQLAFSIDLKSGTITEGTLESQGEPIAMSRFLQPGGKSPYLTFDRTFLSYDNTTLTAWVAAP